MAYTFTPPRTNLFQQRSIKGVRDTRDFAAITPEYFSDALNVYPYHIAGDASWLGRPGFTQLGQRLGTVDNRKVQWMGVFNRLDGSRTLHAIAAGVFYTFDWGTSLWSAASGSPHFNATARIYHCIFFDKLILTDGVGKPRMWDGTAFTTLTNAPVAYGKPVVHFAKLFFINNAVRNEIQWSEENQPNTGYAVGGYNNAWQVSQTSTEPFFAMFPFEEQLLLFRERSITAIYGAVSPEYRSTGVREAVSTTVGTNSPDCLVDTPRGLYFVDSEMRPFIYRNGEGVREIYTDCQVAVDEVDTTAGNRVVAVYDRRFGLVIFGLVERLATQPNRLLVFEAEKGAYCGQWSGFIPVSFSEVITDAGELRIIHATENGYVYLHGNDRVGPWDDEKATLDGGTTAIAHRIVGAPLAYNINTEVRVQKLDMIVRFSTNGFLASIRYETPRGRSSALAIPFTSTNSQWNQVQWNNALWSGIAYETKRTVGLNGLGRWIRPEMTHEVLGQQFGWVAWTIHTVINNQKWQIK